MKQKFILFLPGYLKAQIRGCSLTCSVFRGFHFFGMLIKLIISVWLQCFKLVLRYQTPRKP